jgi:hypothetical protein
MNPDSENFDSLRQLLTLKRHEIPPPGYFDRFSRDVMARIKSGDTGDEFAGRTSWFQRLLGMFDVKPVFAGAFGTAVCAFLVSGIISSEQTPVMGSIAPIGNPPLNGAVPVNAGLAMGDQVSTTSNSVAGNSLFDQYSSQYSAGVSQVSDRFYFPAGHN